jgi:hypothetical protein
MFIIDFASMIYCDLSLVITVIRQERLKDDPDFIVSSKSEIFYSVFGILRMFRLFMWMTWFAILKRSNDEWAKL